MISLVLHWIGLFLVGVGVLTTRVLAMPDGRWISQNKLTELHKTRSLAVKTLQREVDMFVEEWKKGAH